MSTQHRPPRRVVVVGGGLAGARSCEHLRRLGYDGEIVLIAAEDVPPYDRPPLSKGFLLGAVRDTTLGVDLDGLGVDLQIATRATGLDLDRRLLFTSRGEGVGSVAVSVPGRLCFDALVLATGASPVLLPGTGAQLPVRTVHDAHALRRRLRPGTHVVVVGAGWIGAEIATSALALGCRVTCVEAGEVPHEHALGSEVGKRLVEWWSEVDCRFGTTVDHVADGEVVLADGTRLVADIVVPGIGVRPETDWLDGSGLRLDRGVVVDEWMRAAPGVVAVGDVAARWSPRYGRTVRAEHWEDAGAAPSVAAAALLDGSPHDVVPEIPAYDPVPYFWSDQFGHKLQYVGRHDGNSRPIHRPAADGRGWSTAWLGTDGRLVAVLTVDRPRDLLDARRALTSGAVPDPARLADSDVPLSDA